ncbi:hypothetical protein LY76DRAFT_389503 [Colletotrichum caudatum]|nr:hypothetical protein LY76DRAFT_389503 [Colletotrichum caudatum]
MHWCLLALASAPSVRNRDLSLCLCVFFFFFSLIPVVWILTIGIFRTGGAGRQASGCLLYVCNPSLHRLGDNGELGALVPQKPARLPAQEKSRIMSLHDARLAAELFAIRQTNSCERALCSVDSIEFEKTGRSGDGLNPVRSIFPFMLLDHSS